MPGSAVQSPTSAGGGESGTSQRSSEENIGDATVDPLCLDVVFDLLSNERRRRVLRILLDEPGPTTLGELAERIGSIENDKPRESLTSTERKRVYIALYQCHMPKLDDAKVVEFDENRKTVEPGPNIDQLTPYLQAESDQERNDNAVVLSALSTLAVVALGAYLASSWSLLIVGLVAGVCLSSILAAVAESIR